MCAYLVLDENYSGPGDTTYDLQISNPSTDITASLTVEPATTVSPSGTGTLFGTGSTADPSWYNGSWLYRKELNVQDAQVNCTDEFYEFPIFLAETDTDLQLNALASGNDIFFTNKFGAKLSHEIESYNSTTGEIAVWVEVPHLYCDNNTPLYMYYGNAGASNQEDVAGTWSNGFVFVHHLEETTSGATDFIDSTLNGLNSSNVVFNGSASANVNGIANGAVFMDGTDRIDLSDNALLDPPNDMTVDIWVNFNTIGSESVLFKKSHNVSPPPFESWKMRVNNSDSELDFIWYDSSGNYNVASSATSSVTTGAWNKLTGVVSGNNLTAFVNGSSAGGTPDTKSGTTFNSSSTLYFGHNGGGTNSVNGYIDEIRLLNVARSENWLTTEYNNLIDPGAFAIFESEAGSTELIVTGYGTAATNLPKAPNQYLGGGYAFTINQFSAVVDSIILTETGSLDGAAEVDNIKLYYEYDNTSPYDCTSEDFDGTELKYGLTAESGFSGAESGTAVFSESVSITSSQALCVYHVMDIVGAGSGGRNFNISITDPSTDVSASVSVITNTNQAPAGPGTIDMDASIDRPWFNTNWAYRKVISTNPADVIGSDDHYMFPLAISITDSDLLAAALANGDDIFFTNTYGTKLSHEIETYNSGTGALAVWIKVPHLYYNTATPIVMYYGNSGAANQEDMDGTWGLEYEAVYHMVDYNDSSGNGRHGTVFDGSYITNSTGVFGGAKFFNYPNPSGDPTIDLGTWGFGGQTMTVQSWLNPDQYAVNSSSYSGDRRVFIKASTDLDENSVWYISMGHGTNEDQLRHRVNVGSDINLGTVEQEPASPIVPLNTWSMSSYTYDGTTFASNYNGTTYTSQPLSGNLYNTSPQPMAIGNSPTSIGTDRRPFLGALDEIRILNIARSEDWLNTEYNNIFSMGTFIMAGPEDPLNALPAVNSVSLNAGNNISLTENTTTLINITAQVSDADGFSDIASSSVVVYRSGVGASCSADERNCYTNSCSLINCSGNSCDVSCSVNIHYFADRTDSATYASEYWQARVSAVDASAASAQATSPIDTTEVNTLLALEVQGNIAYGNLDPGNDTGLTNSIITVENTGNSQIDIDVSGSNLCTDYPTCSGGVIPVGNQEFDISPFAYGGGITLSSIATQASYPINVAVNSSTPETELMYWGISIPIGIPSGAYTGVNTLIAVEY